ncbi:hypothetical protein Tco_0716587 [Tanacetum coccineum]
MSSSHWCHRVNQRMHTMSDLGCCGLEHHSRAFIVTPSDIQHSAATQIWGCYKIFKDHHVKNAITTSATVPQIYIKEFWNMIRHIKDDKNSLVVKLNQQEVVFTVDTLRIVLLLPQRTDNNHHNLKEILELPFIIKFLKQLGYSDDFTTISQFKRKHIP